MCTQAKENEYTNSNCDIREPYKDHVRIFLGENYSKKGVDRQCSEYGRQGRKHFYVQPGTERGGRTVAYLNMMYVVLELKF